jgi:hypothetical protein
MWNVQKSSVNQERIPFHVPVSNLIVKVKFALEQTIKAWRGSKGIVLLFL